MSNLLDDYCTVGRKQRLRRRGRDLKMYKIRCVQAFEGNGFEVEYAGVSREPRKNILHLHCSITNERSKRRSTGGLTLGMVTPTGSRC